MVYVVFSKSWLNPASYICCLEKEEEERENEIETVRSPLPSLAKMTRYFLIDRAVADPAAQHHTEDHLEDLGG